MVIFNSYFDITRGYPSITSTFPGSAWPRGLKVVDVVGWAPTADTLALAENKCTKERFTGFTMVQPTVTTANANNDAGWKKKLVNFWMIQDGLSSGREWFIWSELGVSIFPTKIHYSMGSRLESNSRWKNKWTWMIQHDDIHHCFWWWYGNSMNFMGTWW